MKWQAGPFFYPCRTWSCKLLACQASMCRGSHTLRSLTSGKIYQDTIQPWWKKEIWKTTQFENQENWWPNSVNIYLFNEFLHRKEKEIRRRSHGETELKLAGWQCRCWYRDYISQPTQTALKGLCGVYYRSTMTQESLTNAVWQHPSDARGFPLGCELFPPTIILVSTAIRVKCSWVLSKTPIR